MGDWRYARKLIHSDDFIIAADGGYSHCTSMGIIPHLAMGDFDSYRGDISKECEILRFPKEKDDTDTMLAIKEALSRGYDELVLMGMMGGRMDHSYANIQALVYAVSHGAQTSLVEKNLWITAITSGQSLTVPCQERFILSVFAHTDRCTGVTLENLKYTLTDAVVTNGIPMGVSNEFLPGKDAHISVGEGTLIIMCTKE